jgi:general secretion pathway protein H
MSRAGRGGARRPSGFSLLEILMVMAIIAIASLLAVAVLTGGVDGLRLRSSAREIAANLRHTRAQALATGRPQKFVVDPAAHAWRTVNDRHGEIPRKLGIVFTGTRGLQARAGEGAILFFPDGASTGGRVQLQAGKAAMNVDVAWLTGEVTLKRGEADR